MNKMKRLLTMLLIVCVTVAFMPAANMEEAIEAELVNDAEIVVSDQAEETIIDDGEEEIFELTGDEEDPASVDEEVEGEEDATVELTLDALTYAKTIAEANLYAAVEAETPFATLDKDAFVLVTDVSAADRFGVAFNTEEGPVSAYMDAAGLLPMDAADMDIFYAEIDASESVVIYNDNVDYPLPTLTLKLIEADKPVEEEPAEEEPAEEEPAEEEPTEEEPAEEEPAEEEPAEEEPTEEEPAEEEPAEEEPAEEEPAEEEPAEEEPAEEKPTEEEPTEEEPTEEEEVDIVAEEAAGDVDSSTVPTISKVTAPTSVTAKQLVKVSVTTTANATHLALVNEDNWTVTVWAADLFSSVSGSSRVWNVQYAFQTAGDRKLGMRASADGDKFGDTSWFNLKVVDQDEATALALYSVEIIGGSSTASKEATFRAVTSTDVKKLAFDAEGGNQVYVWDAADCAKTQDGKLVWTAKYTIWNAGTRTLTFKVGADGTTWNTSSSKSITFIVNPPVLKVEAPASVAVKEPVTMKVTTNKFATHLALVKEDGGTVTTWSAGSNSVLSGDNRVWTVQYTFAGEGERSLGMKASSDARNWSDVVKFNLKITPAEMPAIPTISKVTAPTSVTAKQLVKVSVTTTANATHLALVNEDNWTVTVWAADLFSSVSGSSRVWNVQYAFQTAGDRKLGMRASADGDKFGDTSWFNLKVVDQDEATALALYSVEIIGGSSTASKEATFRAVTSTDVKKLAFDAEGGNQVYVWDAADCAKTQDGKLVWTAKYTIWNAGTRTLTFKVGADGTTWNTSSSKSITFIVNPPVLKVEAPASVAVKEPVTMKVTTNKFATHLALVKEDGGTVTTWSAGSNSVLSGDNRVWTVQYTFAGEGARSLGMKASSDARNWSDVVKFDLVIGDVEQIVNEVSAKLSEVTVGSDAVFTVKTAATATTLAAYSEDGTQIDEWDAATYSVKSGDERVWTVKYALENAGSQTLTFKASVDGTSYDGGMDVALSVVTTGEFVFGISDDFQGAIVKSYLQDAATVTVPDTYADIPVTKIGDSAFEGKTGLTTITLPDTIEIIGKRAFANCTNLSSMNP